MFSYSLHSTALLATLCIGAAALPSSLRAQRTADSTIIAAQISTVATLRPMASADAAPAVGRYVVPVGITRRMPIDSLSALQAQDQGRHLGAGPNLALMGTGGAGVVIGLLVGGGGGTAIALGGGVLGLVGLYRYLR